MVNCSKDVDVIVVDSISEGCFLTVLLTFEAFDLLSIKFVAFEILDGTSPFTDEVFISFVDETVEDVLNVFIRILEGVWYFNSELLSIAEDFSSGAALFTCVCFNGANDKVLLFPIKDDGDVNMLC